MESKKGILIRASVYAILGNTLLAGIKIVGGIISGSLAVLGDGLDTAGDIFTSIVTLVASTIVIQPPNKLRPYGYGKADAVASNILSFVIIFAGLQLGISTVKKFFYEGSQEIPGNLALYVTGISIAGKVLLTMILYHMGRKAHSSMLIANAKNMRGDVVISLAVLAGLFFTLFLQMPIIDLIIALGVSIWIICVGVGIFRENNTELLDGVDDSEIYDHIFKAVDSVDGAHSPHRTRVRKNGSYYAIVLDIEVDGNISVTDAHDIAQNVEDRIKACVENVYDVIVHIEPLGNDEDERFGVSL